MQHIVALDHRRQHRYRYLPRTIDLVVVELLRRILLVAIQEKILAQVKWYHTQYGLRIILFLASVVLIVETLCPPLGLMLGSLSVKEVLALCLCELVDFSTSKACDQLLCELMRYGLAYGTKHGISGCVF